MPAPGCMFATLFGSGLPFCFMNEPKEFGATPIKTKQTDLGQSVLYKAHTNQSHK